MVHLSPEQVVTGYGRAAAAVRAAVVAFAAAAWRAQGSYRDADVDALVALIVPRVRAGQVQVANLTSAYIAQVATLRTGVLVSPVGVDVAAVTGGRGVPAEDVYRRPAVEVYTALAGGASYPDAVSRGLGRLVSLVSTDVQMAKVRQSRASMGASGARFYRRVLNGGDNCAMCMLASTQRYRVKDLSPIHPGCDCSVDPLPPGEDEFQVLDPDEVERIHAAVGERLGVEDRGGRAVDYRKLVIVREHGEYGPTLTLKGHRFTGPEAARSGIDLSVAGLARA